jgi:membrane protease YdiL (CAAX protease family)
MLRMASSRSSQISLPAVIALWAVVVLLAAFWGIRAGFTGRRFAIALGVAAALFAFELFLAVPRVLAAVQRFLAGHGSLLAALVPLFAVLLYSFSVAGNWKTILAGAVYAIVPALLLAGVAGKTPGDYRDYAAAIIIWLPVEFRWMYRVFPYPAQLTHTLTVLLAISIGAAAFVLVRRLEGVGYALEWRPDFAWNFGFHFIVFTAIAIPLGTKIGFLTWGPSLRRADYLPLDALGILLFTAWPEEFLFRGVLQNLLSKTFGDDWVGLVVASVIFGLSHIFHAPYPNWKYVLLATIAGIFYGRAWMKTRSLVPGVLIHFLVDFSWHILFK